MTDITSSVESYSKTFNEIFDRVDSSHMYNTQNKKYVDFFTGAGTMNYGHNNKVSTDAIVDYLRSGRIVHSLDLNTPAKLDFFDTFNKYILEPRELDMKIQLVSPSGTNSVEAAFKLARKSKKRKEIFAFDNGFHGMTLGSLGATSNPYYKNEFTPDTNVKHFPFNSTKLLLTEINQGNVPAGIILETIQADGGVQIATVDFLQDLRKICDVHDIALIIDDIQVGNGRTGDFFSFERADIIPDMICVSKGIAGGMPMSILLYKSKYDIWKPGEHSGTFRGNNLSFVSATSLIKEYWSNDRLSESVKSKSIIIEHELRDLEDTLTCVYDVRVHGMIAGIEMTMENAYRVRKECFERGLILELVGRDDDIVKIMPPLVIDVDTLRDGLKLIKTVIKELEYDRK